MAEIPITGLASNYRVPGAFAEILFGQGPSSAGVPNRDAVIVMPLLTTGSWTAATLYGPLRNEAEVSAGAGDGSPLHRAFRIMAKANRDGDIYALPVAETTGGSPVKANLDLTWATDPTGSGVTTIFIAGERLDVDIARSTEYKIIRTARGRLIKILNTAKYARPLEKGHKPFFLKPRSGKTLRFVMNGKVAFSRGHMIPETQPTFFLKTATQRAFGKFVMGMNAESRKLTASFKKMRA